MSNKLTQKHNKIPVIQNIHSYNMNQYDIPTCCEHNCCLQIKLQTFGTTIVCWI